MLVRLVPPGLVMTLVATLLATDPAPGALPIDPRAAVAPGDDPAAASIADDPAPRPVDYLKQVRPILSQHCYNCHGPDEEAREADLRLDLKQHAFAAAGSRHIIAPGNLDGSLVWRRITTDDERKHMPPAGTTEPLTQGEIATLKAWIEQGATWQDHWSFVPPVKPTPPQVSDPAWVRDPLDAFVLARLDAEHLAPEAEASREAWLRRASFDLTGLPPTLAEIEEFLKDHAADAFDRQADRLLASPRYGERQAQEWLDLARYADTGGYQNDSPRKVWKWREWVINAYNANMPFDQFAIEQLAGDLLPDATLAQRVATGFNRNHPTNSEAGEEEDEYRSAYVIDRVNTTATVFMGLTLACAQCHDHKYDPISQRDYYGFYAFFNNVKERDSDFGNPRPSIPVPNPDQEPRLADLKARIDVLKERLERDDPLTDAAQQQWQARAVERLGAPIEWVVAEPSGMLSRNGSILRLQADGSILSCGVAPVKDTYDVTVLPGKKHIAALRIEVLPDDSQPEKGLGRATDGRFILNAIEIRNSTLSDSQEPPLVYVSRADADINQTPKEDPSGYDMTPGSIESAIVVEPVGGDNGDGFSGRRFGSGWSIVDDERKQPHEAVFVPLDALDTNEASVLRFSLHHTSSSKFKSLIGRFRISYTEDDRVRELLLPAQTRLWSSLGPFAAEDVTKAYTTAFEPEQDITQAPLDLTRSYAKVEVESAPEGKGGGGPPDKGGPSKKPSERATTPAVPMAAPAVIARTGAEQATPQVAATDPPMKQPHKGGKGGKGGKPSGGPAAGDGSAGATGEVTDAAASGTPASAAELRIAALSQAAAPAAGDPAPAANNDAGKAEATKDEPAKADPSKADGDGGRGARKPEKVTWSEQRTWRDGSSARLDGANAVHYLTRKIVSTRPRTAMVKVDGPAGFKLWLNGELVHASMPEPPPPPAPKDDAKAAADKAAKAKQGAADAEDEDEEPAGPDPDEFDFDEMMGRGRSKTEQSFRIGLRQGDNEIVIKAVFGGAGGGEGRRGFPFGGMAGGMGGGSRRGSGGGSFTFDFTPEGEDVINHEVATALRSEAAATVARPTTPPADATVLQAPSAAPDRAIDGGAAPHGPHARTDRNGGTTPDVPAARPVTIAADGMPQKVAEDAPNKVSLVGEKSAPLKSDEQANVLSPAERRAKVLRDYYRTTIDPVGRILAEELRKLKDEEKLLKRQIPETLVMEELDQPRQAYVFGRGLYKNRGEEVAPATPAVLPPMDDSLPHNRLGLARWLMSPQQPLTARVLVNRIWKQYFGLGLVRTAEDFGIRAELPTHPELLDYLATELIDCRWDQKALHRRIVLSATYRQAARVSAEKLERDAENRLLCRGPRLRLDAEMIRDNALAASGLLFEQIGGPSVKPMQPKNAWKTVEGNRSSSYRRDRDQQQYRRALYVYWKRGSPYPSMLNFDAVKRDACTVSRATTITPVQALTLLNDPAYIECAKMLAQRMLKDKDALGRARDLPPAEADARRLAYGFRLCTSRAPSAAEAAILQQLLDDQRAHFKADAEAAGKLLQVGDSRVDAALDPAEAAAWTCVGNALLNLDATIHRG